MTNLDMLGLQLQKKEATEPFFPSFFYTLVMAVVESENSCINTNDMMY